MKTYYYSLADTMRFGKHKGISIRQLIDQHPDYVEWCMKNIAGFRLKQDAMDYGHFSYSCSDAASPKPEAPEASAAKEWREGDEVEVLSHYPWRDMAEARKRYFEQMSASATDAILIPVAPVQLSLFC